MNAAMTPEQRNNRLNTLLARLDMLRSCGCIYPELREAVDHASLIVSAIRFDDPERLTAEVERVAPMLQPYRKEG